MTTSTPSTAKIVIRDLVALRQVGMHPWEKYPERLTRLLLNIEIETTLEHYYGACNRFIDYDPLRTLVATWPTLPHTEQLETILEELVDFIFARTPAQRCSVRIEKPDIFPEAQGVGVAFAVSRADWAGINREPV